MHVDASKRAYCLARTYLPREPNAVRMDQQFTGAPIGRPISTCCDVLSDAICGRF